MHGRQIFLPEQLYGQVRIHTDSDFNGTTRICGQIEYHRKTHNEYIYARVTKGMYGIPQSGRIAHGALVKHLETYGYHPSSKKPRPWKHNSRQINFTLVVDDFGVKCLGKEHALHLKSALETK